MKRYVILFCIALTAVSCSKLEKISFQGEAQGTYYAITYYDDEERNFQPQVDSILDEFDQIASLWVENSELSRFNRNEIQIIDSIFKDLFLLSMEVSKETEGAFDITMGPLVNAWGFGFKGKLEMTQEIVDSLKQFTGTDKIRLENNEIIKEDKRIKIDFNAIAQGYSVDLLASFLESEGIDRYLIDVGGEVYAKGQKPGGERWKVGIEKPAESALSQREVQVVVFLKDNAMATSGNYRKFYEKDGVRYSHTIDPETGYPVQHSLLSATVIASDCASADAYATAFMVMGLENAKEFLRRSPGLDAYFIYSEDGKNKVWFSNGMRNMIHQ